MKNIKPQSLNCRIRLENDTQNTKGKVDIKRTELKKVLTRRLIRVIVLDPVAVPFLCKHSQ